MTLSRLLLLSLALLAAPLWGQDCVPVSLQYLSTLTGQSLHHTTSEWSRAVGTNAEGSDLDRVQDAWRLMSLGQSRLVCTYTASVDPEDHTPSAVQLRTLMSPPDYNPSAAINPYHPYLWVGIHHDLITPSVSYLHCAVVYLRTTHVLMLSPNSCRADGTMLIETFDWETFMRMTLATFDVQAIRGQ